MLKHNMEGPAMLEWSRGNGSQNITLMAWYSPNKRWELIAWIELRDRNRRRNNDRIDYKLEWSRIFSDGSHL